MSKTVEITSVRRIAGRLRDLCADVDNQTYIVKEKECISGIVGFLSHHDTEAVAIALQAVVFLSSHPANKAILAENSDLINNVLQLAMTTSHDMLKTLSTEVFMNLRSVVDETILDNVGITRSPVVAVEVPKAPNVVTKLPIQGLNNEEKYSIVEKILMELKGVLSFTIDTSKECVHVRSRGLDASAISTALIKCGLISREKHESADKENVGTINCSTPKSAKDTLYMASPMKPKEDQIVHRAYGESIQYLDPAPVPTNFFGGIATTHQLTLEERLEQQRRRELRRQQREGRLFGRLGRALNIW